MRARALLVAAAAALTTLSGCLVRRGGSTTPVVVAPGAWRDSLVGADVARGDSVARRGWPAGMVGWLTDDVIYLHAGAPTLIGRESAASLLAQVPPPPGAVVAWQPLGAEVSRDGRAGYTFGTRTTTSADSTGRQRTRFDRYIAFWRRGTSGGWRIAAYADVSGAPVSAAVGAALVAPRPSYMRPHGERAEQALRKMREGDSLFAILGDREGTGHAFSTYAAENGVLFDGPLLTIGPRAIRAYFDGTRSSSSLSWSPAFADIGESGDLGFTVGDYVVTGRGPTGAAVQRFGKYLTVWKLQADGRWRYQVDGGNPSPSPRNP